MFDFTLDVRRQESPANLIYHNDFFTFSGDVSEASFTLVQQDYAFFLWGDIHVYGRETVDPGGLAEGICHGSITVKEYYGAFFWLLLDNRAGEVRLMCDPFGQCPVCWLRTASGAYRFVSQAGLSLGDCLDRAVSHDFLSRFVQTGARAADRTALDGLNMLVPGYGYHLDRAQHLTADDIMGAVLESVQFGSPYEALAYAIADKIRQQDNIVIELSGGVESSCLAAVLSRYRRDKQIRCITYYDASCYASNEVAQARAVADFFGLTHEIIDLGATLPFTPPRETMPFHLLPSVYSCLYEQQRRIAERYGDDVLFMCGHGGDALFLAPPPARLMVDALMQSGINAALHVWYSVALQRRTPLLATLLNACGTAELHHTREDDLYVNRERQSRRPTTRQQWQELRWTVLETVPLLNARYTGKHTCYPFLTAPVVLHALRSRMASLVHYEFNRFSLRKSAYLDTLCPGLWRTDKGDTTHNMLMGLTVNADYVRRFLQDGALAARGLFQPQALMKDLNALQRGRDDVLPTLVRLFCAEAMLRTLD